jgi:hypothetical protein
MNKTMLLPNYIIRTVILSSLTASLGILNLTSPSIADQEVIYRNCAELQKVISNRNPGDRYQGFEKSKMMRQNYEHGQYMVFCNGGIIRDRAEGTICRGYIAYSFHPIPSVSHYYARWGRTEGPPNFNDTGQDRYCRRIQ